MTAIEMATLMEAMKADGNAAGLHDLPNPDLGSLPNFDLGSFPNPDQGNY